MEKSLHSSVAAEKPLLYDFYAKCWAELEKASPPPKVARDIKELPFAKVRDAVAKNDRDFARWFCESIYAGDVFIMPGAFSPSGLRSLKDAVFKYGQEVITSDSKMLDGCTNFHQIVDAKQGPRDGYTALDHSFYFFRWNPDTLGVIKFMSEQWRIVKVLSGNAPDAFEKNIPSDLIVDRVQVIHYAQGIGTISPHRDPYAYQKIIFGGVMTEIGKDFETGGFAVVNRDRKLQWVEKEVPLGAAVSLFPSICHTVSPIDKGKPVDWGSPVGRWYINFNTIESHHKPVRRVSQSVSEDAY